MDYTLPFDNYIKYEKGEAYDLYCDEKNLIRFKRILIFLEVIIGISLGEAVVSIFSNSTGFFSFFRIVFYGFAFVIVLMLLLKYKKLFNISNIRKRVLIFVIAFIIAFTSFATVSLISSKYLVSSNTKNNAVENPETQTLDKNQIDSTVREKLSQEDGTSKNERKKNNKITIDTTEEDNTSKTEYAFYFCIIILFLCLSKSEYIQLYSLAYGLPFISHLVVAPSFVFTDGLAQTIVFFALTLLSFIISNTLNTKRQKKFFRSYNYYYKKNYETLRMKKELDYARQIQLSMLPDSKKVINGISISATSIPAMEVGGDYFDYFELPDGKVGVFICDVSGHGVASALLLSGLRSSIHLILEDTHNPKEIFKKLNLMVRKTQQRKMFVTALFAVIDPEKNTLSFFNAGHLPPYKIDKKNGELFLLKKHGITLGVLDNISYEKEDSGVVIDFNEEDKFILYTDGLNEALNKSREEYGFERIENLLNNHLDTPSDKLLSTIIEDVNKFMEGAEQIDDLTVVIIERLKKIP